MQSSIAISKGEIDRLVADALAHHTAGRLPQAEAGYRRVLEADPDHGEALHYFGVLALQVNKPAVAIQLIGRALELMPRHAPAHSNLGTALRREGRTEEAVAAYRRALALEPAMPDALNNLANALIALNQAEEAREIVERLAPINPAAAADLSLGISRVLLESERYAEALPVLERCLALDPARADAYSNLGVALRKLERTAEAMAGYRRGLQYDPANASLLNNLAIVRQEQTDFAAAEALFSHAIRSQPDYKEARLGLVNVLRLVNRTDLALAASRDGVARHPDFADLHFSLGFNLLMRGEYREGFAEYEWRTRMKSFEPKRNFTAPCWSGEPLAGRRLLIHDEQGVGDAMQFLRFLKRLPPGTDYVMECNTQLVRLLRAVPYIPEVAPRSLQPPAHDLRASLVSLPHLLGLGLDELDGGVPYLHAEPELAETWRRLLEAGGRELRVGLVWAGSTGFADDRLRSPRLDAFLPLLDVPGVRFFGLQMGDGRSDLERLRPQLPDSFTDLGPVIRDFADTAAILANCDLLISSCTSPVHLSGGLGRPTWVVLPFAPDWRWMLGREDSPWYDTVRLFRQDQPGRDWRAVVERVRDSLTELARRHGN